jgi:RNA polymerase sigma-70 factor (ECF subfamily)
VTERDRDGFEATMAVHYPRLVARLALVVRDPQEAQDLVQETMLRAWRDWGTLRQDDVGGWLHTVGMRLALDELRRRRRRRPWLVRDADGVAPDSTADPDLWTALGKLGRGERAAVVLHLVDGYSYAEIADRLGVPEGTVASWMSRGKTHLRHLLRDEVT